MVDAAVEVTAFLTPMKLAQFSAAIQEEYYEFVDDLLDADDAELEELALKVGMNKPQTKRFIKAVKAKKSS